jgi:hypothetical protein
MDHTHIPATARTPEMAWHEPTGCLSICGTSVPEHAMQFYRPAVHFCETAVGKHEGPFTVRVDLTYFNSSSLKALFNVLRPLKAGHEQGKAVRVEWVVDEDDEFMQESGETLMDLLGFPFHFVPKRPTPGGARP